MWSYFLTKTFVNSLFLHCFHFSPIGFYGIGWRIQDLGKGGAVFQSKGRRAPKARGNKLGGLGLAVAPPAGSGAELRQQNAL